MSDNEYGEVLTGGDEEQAEVPSKRQRLHHLDWFRGLMVVFVVYAHIAMNDPEGINPHSGVAIDNYNFVNSTMRNSLTVRHVSVIRPWCLPLLFFISGAAGACSFKECIGNTGAIPMLAIVTVVGVVSNAILWLLGPRDPSCGVGDGCTKGLLFTFTFVPHLGTWFPIIFQMWYTALLIVLILLNWPLFAVAHGRGAMPWRMFLHLFIWVTIYISVLLAAGSACQYPVIACSLLVMFEVVFIGVVFLLCWRPSWMPLRSVQYALAATIALQYACTPYFTPPIGEGSGITLPWMLATFGFFNKCFQLGFLMTLPRSRRDKRDDDQALPLISQYWPFMIFPAALCSPSTNYSVSGGNLTYPYFFTFEERVTYVAFALIVMFSLDRMSCWTQCKPLPAALNWSSLLLYLLHPVVCSFWLALGIRNVMVLWILSMSIIFYPVALITWFIVPCIQYFTTREDDDDDTSTSERG